MLLAECDHGPLFCSLNSGLCELAVVEESERIFERVVRVKAATIARPMERFGMDRGCAQ